jgi:predicted DNA-binding transcriptional regulator YafY
MRYGRVEDIIKLVILMQSKYNGVSIEDIQEHFQVSRRTAERMRDAVLRLFPQIDEVQNTGRVKRWAFKNYSVSELISFTPEEFAELENTRKKLELDGLNNKAETINEILSKIKVLNKAEQSRIETDLEALLEAEGYAIRQYPRFKVEKQTLEKIRDAIKAFKKLEVAYKKKEGDLNTYILHPYGLLYGEKNYLVAYSELRQEVRMYILSNIQEIKVIDEYFEKDENFDLTKYSENSFGIYQEEPLKVALEFDKSVAEDVKNFHFHPTQKIKDNKDGTVKVEFTAAGSLAICWHLFKWGKLVKVIKPASLKKEYKQLLTEAFESIKK